MEKIIAELCDNLKKNLEKLFKEGNRSLDYLEGELLRYSKEVVAAAMVAFIEELDDDIRLDKKSRKEKGMVIERRNEQRSVLSLVGELNYRRTYYRYRDGTYGCPIDDLLEIESRQRVSDAVCKELVNKSREFSYDKSAKLVTDSRVSKQTVMLKIRQSVPVEPPLKEILKKVPYLHIDADEDHISLQNGKKGVVPLISLYEGVERTGKRGKCKNIKHFSAYKKSTSELWEEVGEYIEETYDIEKTKIYLHGDGAVWIRQGLEYIPKSSFVLDSYHRNKAVKQLFAGNEVKIRNTYEPKVRKELEEGDKEGFEVLTESLKNEDNAGNVEKAKNYLLNNWDGIKNYYNDAEAAACCSTEPHISHVLSSRLSSRPMGWSEKTLKKFVPILVSEDFSLGSKKVKPNDKKSVSIVKQKINKKDYIYSMDPDRAYIVNCPDEMKTNIARILNPDYLI